jgi:DNA-binding MarR family transcriptional regulator
MEKKRTIDLDIKLTWLNISRMYNTQADQYDFSTSAAFVLLHMDDTKGTQLANVAPMLGMEASSMTRLINGMEDKGLITRRRENLRDRRQVLIYLTETGRKAKSVAKIKVKHFNKKIATQLSPEKIDTFYEVIDVINALINTNDVYTDEPKLELSEILLGA